MTAVQTRALRRCFGTLTAVADLDFAVERGEIFGLVGPDGAGKSTTLRMLTGVLPPTRGEIVVDGIEVHRAPEAVKPRIGYMSQRFGLYGDLTVQENLTFYADLQELPRAARRERFDELLGFSQLTPFRDRLATHLSGGMKQKLGLACAMVHRPPVLFLDEPTNGVDPVSRRDFWRILYQLVRDGTTLVVSTAYLDEAERCHRLALLHEGRLLGLGAPADIKRLMPGTLLEVRTSAPRRAAQLLREHLPGRPVGLFGDRVHVTTPEPELDRTRAEDVVRADGLELQSIRPIAPTLEDVFVAVLADADQRGAAGRRLSPNANEPAE